MQGLFVTGTDTEVGKTYIACQILRELKQLHSSIRLGAYKPVCSGAERDQQGRLFWSDIDRLSLACEGHPSEQMVCPQRYNAAVAPPRAAALEGRQVDECLLVEGLNLWESNADVILVEGAGGLLSPVSKNLNNADLAGLLGYPLLIVARAGLGTINHTLLTIEAAQHRGFKIAGVVLNEVQPDKSDQSLEFNWQDLATRTEVSVLGYWPHLSDTIVDRRGQASQIDWVKLFDIGSRSR